MKKKIFFPLAITFIILCGVLLIVLVLQYGLIPGIKIPSNQISKDETVNWETFTKIDKWGDNHCSIKYPDNWQPFWHLNTPYLPPEGIWITDLEKVSSETASVSVFIDCFSKEKADEYANTGENLLSICKKEEFSLYSIEKGASENNRAFCILSDDDSKIGTVKFVSKYNLLDEEIQPELDILNQMLPTFRFLEKQEASVELCKYFISQDEQEEQDYDVRKELINIEMQKGGVTGLECPFKIKDTTYYIFFDRLGFIKIFDENKNFLQNIELTEEQAREAMWLFTNYGQSVFDLTDDINFDGYNDLRILNASGYMGVNLYYSFYTFNSQNKKFEYALSICNPTVDYDEKKIYYWYKSGSKVEGGSYKFDGENYIKEE